MKKLLSLAMVLLTGLLMTGCRTVNDTSSPENHSIPPYEHSTIYPEGNEVSFELTPNTGCSVVVYLEENQIMNVHYLFSPTDLGWQFIEVKYTYPEGNDVGVSNQAMSYQTLPHGEGYYSLDFYYHAEHYTTDELKLIPANIIITVHYEISYFVE